MRLVAAVAGHCQQTRRTTESRASLRCNKPPRRCRTHMSFQTAANPPDGDEGANAMQALTEEYNRNRLTGSGCALPPRMARPAHPG
jgi:hypothetical protein